MDKSATAIRAREQAFNRRIVTEYLTYGSVDEVFKKNNWELPISYPGFHHLLKRWNIIKAAGPNTKFSETVAFLEKLAQDNIPVEKLYRELPPGFQTSAKTLYRVLANVRHGITRRYGTALLISAQNNSNQVVIGNDVSSPRLEFGKHYGSVSLPMGFARRGEPRETSILRVLQREVFTELTVRGRFPYGIIPDNPEPFMHLYIADVSVAVYHLHLPHELAGELSSNILTNLRFISIEELMCPQEDSNLRTGIADIAGYYDRYLTTEEELPMRAVSSLNAALNPALALDREI